MSHFENKDPFLPNTPIPANFDQPGGLPTTLAQLTTLQVGGRISEFCPVNTQDDFVDAVKSADHHETQLLVIGGGSNILASDRGFAGRVVQDQRHQIWSDSSGMCGGALVSATAGTPWDDFVRYCIDHDYMGLESLSGIPGTVGAAPVQNIGAYGTEVAEYLYTVTVYDRLTEKIQKLPAPDLQLSYRNSLIKQSLTCADPEVGGGRLWGPTGRWVVLEVQFQLRHADLSAPIRYRQLADYLQIDLEERVPLTQARAAVLELRRSKGMVLDEDDPDTCSAGSFFTNPIISAEQAEQLPDTAPRFPVLNTALTNPVTGLAPVIPGQVKTSAAWLIEHAGFTRGYSLCEHPEGARLSTKHVLALTNPGAANCEDLVRLAGKVQQQVCDAYHIWLEPEPVWVANPDMPSPIHRH